MKLVELLEEGIKYYGIELSEKQIKQFDLYMNLLLEWNEKINLTAITDEEGIIKKHFIDSASILKSDVIKINATLVDVGTGAGFPGIPLKIIRPDVKVTLIDSLNKRLKFLDIVIKELGLSEIETVHGRAEEMSKNKNFREKFDISTARAVANLGLLSEFCIPYVKQGGHFIAMKGPSGYEELEAAKKAINILGGKFEKIVETSIKDEEMKHNLVIIKKINATQGKYPRRFAIIEKNPL